MSADYWLDGVGDCPTDHTYNVTYNLRKMLQTAGFPPWRALVGAPAVEAAGVLQKVADTLRANPERFKQYNPQNGWGDYDGAVLFVETFAAGCAEHPEAVIGGWL